MKKLLMIFVAVLIMALVIVLLVAPVLKAQDVVWPNPNFVYIYGGNPTLDGIALKAGDVIRAYDVQHVLCGIDTVKKSTTVQYWHTYGFMPIYGDDPWTPGDQGWGESDTLNPGDIPNPSDTFNLLVFLTINGKTTNERVRVEANADGYRIEKFTSCCEKRGDLSGDNKIDLTDLAMVISMFTSNNNYSRYLAYSCPTTSDLNNSGVVDIADLVYLFNYLTLKGPAPVPCK